MGGQTEFLDAVRELERLAQTNNNHLKMEEIRAYFADMNLKEEQLDYICRYLESHRIFIENRISRGQTEIADEDVTTKEDPLDARYGQYIYGRDRESKSVVSEEQEEMLVRKLINGMKMQGTFSLNPTLPTPPLWQKSTPGVDCCSAT